MGGYDSIIDISLHSLYSSMNHQVFGGGVGTKLTCTHPFWLLSWPTIFSSMCAPRSKQDHGWMEGWMDGHCGMALHPLNLYGKSANQQQFSIGNGF